MANLILFNFGSIFIWFYQVSISI